jgi:hypothetical protein
MDDQRRVARRPPVGNQEHPVVPHDEQPQVRAFTIPRNTSKWILPPPGSFTEATGFPFDRWVGFFDHGFLFMGGWWPDCRVGDAGFHGPGRGLSMIVGAVSSRSGRGGQGFDHPPACRRSRVQGQSARRCSQRFRCPRVRRAGRCSNRNLSSFGAAWRSSPAGRARWRKQASSINA